MATYNSKVVLTDGTVLIDLTSDTVEASKLLTGYTAHGRDGALVTGSCDFDADTSDANATAGEILASKTAYVNGSKITGTMPNNGAVSGEISDASTPYTIPQGYHDGSGSVGISATEIAKLDPTKILEGWEILGVTGTLEPASGVTAQSKTATPTFSQQTILPDTGYDYLSQVTVEPIGVDYTENAAGGYTVTIG